MVKFICLIFTVFYFNYATITSQDFSKLPVSYESSLSSVQLLTGSTVTISNICKKGDLPISGKKITLALKTSSDIFVTSRSNSLNGMTDIRGVLCEEIKIGKNSSHGAVVVSFLNHRTGMPDHVNLITYDILQKSQLLAILILIFISFILLPIRNIFHLGLKAGYLRAIKLPFFVFSFESILMFFLFIVSLISYYFMFGMFKFNDFLNGENITWFLLLLPILNLSPLYNIALLIVMWATGLFPLELRITYSLIVLLTLSFSIFSYLRCKNIHHNAKS